MSRNEAQLNFRIDRDDKLMLKRAAEVEGKSLGSFIRDAAVKEATQLREDRISAAESR